MTKPASASGCVGGKNQVDALVHPPARFVQQELAQVVAFAFQILHLLEHRAAGHVQDTAGDDLVQFTGGMSADDSNHAAEFSFANSSLPLGAERVG